MVDYTQNELVSSTEISKVKNGLLDKIGVLKNNKLNAVILSVEEYERMVEAMNTLEDMQIHQEITERLKTPKEEYIDGKEVLEKLNLSLGD